MIPNDPLNRCWVQAEITDPHHFDKVLVSLLAFDQNMRASLVGTGFIIAASPQSALVVTAAHNLEGMTKAQTPWTLSHPSALPEFAVGSTQGLSLDRQFFRAVYKKNSTVEFCVIGQVSWVPELDIALLSIHPQEQTDREVFGDAVRIDSAIPREGQGVFMIAYDKMEVQDQTIDEAGHISSTLARVVALRRGVISAVHLRGTRLSTWPCFETTIPTDPGMSGGMFIWPGEGDQKIVACGVLSSDVSSPDAWKDFRVAGQSNGAMLWPAMGLTIDATDEMGVDPLRVFLHDLVRKGVVVDTYSAGSHVRVVRDDAERVTVTHFGKQTAVNQTS